MKRVLVFFFLLVPLYSFGQILVWKTDCEAACENTGVVYSYTQESVGKLPSTKSNVWVNVTLNTYQELVTKIKIQDFGLGFLQSVRINCSEIDSIISAIEQIVKNEDYVYIVKTGNLKIGGSKNEGCIKLYCPASGSRPGDFKFAYWNDVNSDVLIKLLNDVKAAM